MAKAKIGLVLSVKMAHTAVIAVQSTRSHPLYHKSVRTTKKFHVHDEIGLKVGDKVAFVGTRPLSRTVKWTATKVITTDSKPTAAAKPKQTSKKKSSAKKL